MTDPFKETDARILIDDRLRAAGWDLSDKSQVLTSVPIRNTSLSPDGHSIATEYNDVVLSHIFLKYISDFFEEKLVTLEAEEAYGADTEDRDEYLAENVF